MKTRASCWALRVTAVTAILWSIFRAVEQSVTLDEADTYFLFAAREAKYIWYGFPNNHLLNSLLIWLSTHLFGVSPLTIRLPALMGAALYISVVYFLCQATIDRFPLQLATLTCLVYNPFILDFFAAARGYSLANAFLMAALAIPVWHGSAGRKATAISSALASAAVALSFASNFCFAFADCAALLAITIWAARRRGPHSIARIAICCTLPAAAISLGLCGYPIAHFARKELWYGARSVGEMMKSLVDASMYRPFGPLGNSEAATFLARTLLIVLLVLCILRLIAETRDGELLRSRQARLTAWVGAMILLTLSAHYLAFRIAGLPLPMSRTGIFFLPLVTWLVALITALPPKSLVSRLLGYALRGGLICLAAHCLLCLRYTYFREYEWDADVKDVHRVIERMERTYGVHDIASDGLYTSPLNFYRVIAETGRLAPLPAYPGMVPAGRAVYILNAWYGGYRTFLCQSRLVVVYRGRRTGVVVAVPPDGPVPPLPAAP